MRRMALAFVLLAAQSAYPKSLASYTKTPYEAKDYVIDFSRYVGADGLTLDGIVATEVNTGADSTSIIIAPSPEVAGDVVTFRVQGGSSGETHVISVHVIESVTGEKLDGQITVAIAAR